MRKTFIALAAAATVFAAPAMAQDAGVTVVGNDDAAIGTVASNEDGQVTLDVDGRAVTIGANAFVETDGVWTLNATKEQVTGFIDAQEAEAQAALDAAIAVGATVLTSDEQELGAIAEVTADGVVVPHGGQPVNVPVDMLTLNDEGVLGVRVVGNDNLVAFMPVTLLRDTVDGVWVTDLPDTVDVITVGQEFVTEGVRAAPTFVEAQG